MHVGAHPVTATAYYGAGSLVDPRKFGYDSHSNTGEMSQL